MKIMHEPHPGNVIRIFRGSSQNSNNIITVMIYTIITIKHIPPGFLLVLGTNSLVLLFIHIHQTVFKVHFAFKYALFIPQIDSMRCLLEISLHGCMSWSNLLYHQISMVL